MSDIFQVSAPSMFCFLFIYTKAKGRARHKKYIYNNPEPILGELIDTKCLVASYTVNYRH